MEWYKVPQQFLTDVPPPEPPTDLELHRVPARALWGFVPVVLMDASRLVAGKHPVKTSLTS